MPPGAGDEDEPGDGPGDDDIDGGADEYTGARVGGPMALPGFVPPAGRVPPGARVTNSASQLGRRDLLEFQPRPGDAAAARRAQAAPAPAVAATPAPPAVTATPAHAVRPGESGGESRAAAYASEAPRRVSLPRISVYQCYSFLYLLWYLCRSGNPLRLPLLLRTASSSLPARTQGAPSRMLVASPRSSRRGWQLGQRWPLLEAQP